MKSLAVPDLSSSLSPGARDFIDEEALHELLAAPPTGAGELRDVLDVSRALQPLSLAQTARLLRTEDADLQEEMFETARELKRRVYGNRIVLFAPLYIGNLCINDCRYCGFRRSNASMRRVTLSEEGIDAQVKALQDRGHKRLILVYGEHPRYDAGFIARTVEQVYGVRKGRGEIRRVNINAAPLDVEGFRRVKAAGIGTYQVFQETYHHGTYARWHPAGTRKSHYLWRLDSLDRAMLGGCDDVGLGVLFGLYDWRFEVLGLCAHAAHLEERFDVGCHTISFPRFRPAQGVDLPALHQVSDRDFLRLVAVLRLAVPYTGLILTAREPAGVRRRVMPFGVSQIDAGSRIDFGGYTGGEEAEPDREQFHLGDTRSLDEVIAELLRGGDLPSFCTACYRLGRTGEHFMEYAVPGFIRNFCTRNALCTLTEYLEDYASPSTRDLGCAAVRRELEAFPEGERKNELAGRLRRIREDGERDLFF